MPARREGRRTAGVWQGRQAHLDEARLLHGVDNGGLDRDRGLKDPRHQLRAHVPIAHHQVREPQLHWHLNLAPGAPRQGDTPVEVANPKKSAISRRGAPVSALGRFVLVLQPKGAERRTLQVTCHSDRAHRRPGCLFLPKKEQSGKVLVR